MNPNQLLERPAWSYLTNHAYVLLCLSRDPDARLREVALAVGITERAVQRIVSELEAEAVLSRTKVGRRNTYTITGAHGLRHPLVTGATVGRLLETIKE